MAAYGRLVILILLQISACLCFVCDKSLRAECTTRDELEFEPACGGFAKRTEHVRVGDYYCAPSDDGCYFKVPPNIAYPHAGKTSGGESHLGAYTRESPPHGLYRQTTPAQDDKGADSKERSRPDRNGTEQEDEGSPATNRNDFTDEGSVTRKKTPSQTRTSESRSATSETRTEQGPTRDPYGRDQTDEGFPVRTENDLYEEGTVTLKKTPSHTRMTESRSATSEARTGDGTTRDRHGIQPTDEGSPDRTETGYQEDGLVSLKKTPSYTRTAESRPATSETRTEEGTTRDTNGRDQTDEGSPVRTENDLYEEGTVTLRKTAYPTRTAESGSATSETRTEEGTTRDSYGRDQTDEGSPVRTEDGLYEEGTVTLKRTASQTRTAESESATYERGRTKDDREGLTDISEGSVRSTYEYGDVVAVISTRQGDRQTDQFEEVSTDISGESSRRTNEHEAFGTDTSGERVRPTDEHGEVVSDNSSERFRRTDDYGDVLTGTYSGDGFTDEGSVTGMKTPSHSRAAGSGYTEEQGTLITDLFKETVQGTEVNAGVVSATGRRDRLTDEYREVVTDRSRESDGRTDDYGALISEDSSRRTDEHKKVLTGSSRESDGRTDDYGTLMTGTSGGSGRHRDEHEEGETDTSEAGIRCTDDNGEVVMGTSYGKGIQRTDENGEVVMETSSRKSIQRTDENGEVVTRTSEEEEENVSRPGWTNNGTLETSDYDSKVLGVTDDRPRKQARSTRTKNPGERDEGTPGGVRPKKDKDIDWPEVWHDYDNGDTKSSDAQPRTTEEYTCAIKDNLLVEYFSSSLATAVNAQYTSGDGVVTSDYCQTYYHYKETVSERRGCAPLATAMDSMTKLFASKKNLDCMKNEPNFKPRTLVTKKMTSVEAVKEYTTECSAAYEVWRSKGDCGKLKAYIVCSTRYIPNFLRNHFPWRRAVSDLREATASFSKDCVDATRSHSGPDIMDILPCLPLLQGWTRETQNPKKCSNDAFCECLAHQLSTAENDRHPGLCQSVHAVCAVLESVTGCSISSCRCSFCRWDLN